MECRGIYKICNNVINDKLHYILFYIAIIYYKYMMVFSKSGESLKCKWMEITY